MTVDISNNTAKRWAWITALRGLLMLAAGLYAVFFPREALTILVIAGGILLVVDGVLGLWSATFGNGPAGGFNLLRNVLSIVVGVLILLSPLLATILTAAILIYLVAIQAIIVGAMVIWMTVRQRQEFGRVWPVLLAGVLYVAFGVALVFWPAIGAQFFVVLAGVMMILLAIGLFVLAWRVHKAVRDSEAPAPTPVV